MSHTLNPNEFVRGQEFLDGIVEGVYGRSSFDEQDFEHCLEELCALFDINLPRHGLTVEPKPTERRSV